MHPFTLSVFQQISQTSGIYAIVGPEGKRYIGQSLNVASRLRSHLMYLTRGRHGNAYLQRSWDRHGPTAFYFEVLCEVDHRMLTTMEQHWMDHYRGRGRLYNICPVAGSPRGMKHSLETRQKIGAASSARKRSEETKAKMRAAMTGRSPSLEQRAQISATLTGRKVGPHSAETREKIRQQAIKQHRDSPRIVSSETKEKTRLALLGRVFSPEHRAKLSTARRGRLRGRSDSPA